MAHIILVCMITTSTIFAAGASISSSCVCVSISHLSLARTHTRYCITDQWSEILILRMHFHKFGIGFAPAHLPTCIHQTCRFNVNWILFVVIWKTKRRNIRQNASKCFFFHAPNTRAHLALQKGKKKADRPTKDKPASRNQ